jgi:hypothetical protein
VINCNIEAFESLYYIDERTSLSFWFLLTVIMQETVPQHKTGNKNVSLSALSRSEGAALAELPVIPCSSMATCRANVMSFIRDNYRQFFTLSYHE